MSMRAMRDELREAKENRGAAVGARHLHAGPRAVRGRAVQPGRRRRLLRHRPRRSRSGHARGGVRLARLLALASLVEHEVEVDAAAIAAALTAIREQLEVVRQLKTQLTSISERDQGRLDRARHDALEHPGPRRPRPKAELRTQAG